jgi:hypothetical protein
MTGIIGTTSPVESLAVPEMLPPVPATAEGFGKRNSARRMTRKTAGFPCFNEHTPEPNLSSEASKREIRAIERHEVEKTGFAAVKRF